MPPYLALALCIVFIFVIFKLDSTSNSSSVILWIPTIWLLIIASRPISFWFIASSYSNQSISFEESILEGSYIDRVVYILLIIFGFIAIIRRNVSIINIFNSNRLFIIIIMYAFISIFWSDFPQVALRRWIKFVGSLLMILLVVTEKDSEEAIKIINRRCVYILVPLSIIMYKYFLNIGRGYDAWTGDQLINGISYNKNGLGCLCLTSGLILTWEIIIKNNIYSKNEYRDILIKYLFLGMIIFLLIKSDSMTSLVTMFIGIGIIYILRYDIIKNNINGISIFVAFCLFIYFVAFNIINNMVFKFIGRDATLTGRTELWNVLLAMNTNFLAGVGFESFWLGDRLGYLLDKFQWGPNQAHNGYLEIYLNLGIIGLIIVIGFVYSIYNHSIKLIKQKHQFGSLMLSLVIILLLYNITEAAFLRTTNQLWFIFLVVALQCDNNIKFKIKPLVE